MTREELEIGKYYTGGGEPIYKLVDIGADWVLAIHYSTVHHVATSEFVSKHDLRLRKIRYVADSCQLHRKNCNTCKYCNGAEDSKVYCYYGDKDWNF